LTRTHVRRPPEDPFASTSATGAPIPLPLDDLLSMTPPDPFASSSPPDPFATGAALPMDASGGGGGGGGGAGGGAFRGMGAIGVATGGAEQMQAAIHYNTLVRDRNTQAHSYIYHLRRFNNWVKMLLIRAAQPEAGEA
jgi:hypothetical protein